MLTQGHLWPSSALVCPTAPGVVFRRQRGHASACQHGLLADDALSMTISDKHGVNTYHLRVIDKDNLTSRRLSGATHQLPGSPSTFQVAVPVPWQIRTRSSLAAVVVDDLHTCQRLSTCPLGEGRRPVDDHTRAITVQRYQALENNLGASRSHSIRGSNEMDCLAMSRIQASTALVKCACVK